MRLERIDLNLFIVFEVIYREANLTKAAKVLNITQPAVSNALARLRSTFDDPLFQRKADRMVPTPFAENLIGPVREALWLLNNGVAKQDSFDPAKTKKVIRIGLTEIAAARVLPLLLPALQQTAPGILLDIRPLDSGTLVEALTAAKLDLCIDTPMTPDQRISHTLLGQETYVCAVRSGHSNITAAPDLQQYLACDHLHCDYPAAPDAVDHALNQLGLKRRIKTRLQYSLLTPALLQQSDLVLSLPSALARNYQLDTYPLPFTVMPLSLHLYWHKSVENDAANHWLRQLILSQSPDNPASPPTAKISQAETEPA